MKASEAKLLEFLRKSPQFVIPIYQRTYSWTEAECRQLWDDILRCGKDDPSEHVKKSDGEIDFVEHAILPATAAIVMKMMIGVLAIYFFVGVGDFVYQRFTWMKRQRMTREELKQEYKDTDGNPEIKSKLRQIRTQRLRRRMMAQVPEATVIVTNPTHYAVALKYEAGMDAPICVAKGVDAMALKIREVANDHNVPIIENPPLARALHASIDLDETVPVEHYKAVAEVIGFVLRTRRRRA